MKRASALRTSQASVLILVAAGLFGVNLSARAQEVQHLSIIQPGGMPGMPVMTGIAPVTNGIMITWDGPSGYYQLLQRAALKDAKWQAVGRATNFARNATITALYSNAFFRVLGPSPQYVGAQACAECHQGIHDTELNTRHAHAFETLREIHQDTNSSCLPCHTVGYGLATGFSSAASTPQLEGVQCENCHGPAGNHAANPDDPIVRPRVEIAATVCGGCHAVSQHPIYNQWKTSEHAEVIGDLNSADRLSSCGRCHSGSVRLALLKGSALPAGDANVALTCIVCHDPHQTNSNPAQLRNPLASTNDFYLTTTNAFAAEYRPDINLCAQCHNHRGASWTNTVEAPHPSPQYNFLLGSIGELPGGSATFNPAAHAGLPSSAQDSISGTFYLTNQCVSCHLQRDAPPVNTPNHAFTAERRDVCLNCHVILPGFDPVQDLMVPAISNRVAQLKYALDLWAVTKAPLSLRTNGTLAWEYTKPGGLIWQTNGAGGITGWALAGPVGFPGPDAAGQALIPDGIKRARFNLYLVLNDGSYGVHNPYFAIDLLDAAADWVSQASSP